MLHIQYSRNSNQLVSKSHTTRTKLLCVCNCTSTTQKHLQNSKNAQFEGINSQKSPRIERVWLQFGNSPLRPRGRGLQFVCLLHKAMNLKIFTSSIPALVPWGRTRCPLRKTGFTSKFVLCGWTQPKMLVCRAIDIYILARRSRILVRGRGLNRGL